MKTPFPPLGLTYFWFLNDQCSEEKLTEQIRQFADANVSTICLHPRDGLQFPYGSRSWFEMIAGTVKALAAHGIGTWLYDEYPYPSGNAGGRIVLDHPEYRAKKVSFYQGTNEDIKDSLWYFPAEGPLSWCGIVRETDGKVMADLTDDVGVLSRKWRLLKGWDSRFYYPDTPLYTCDRAMTVMTEYAVKIETIPEGCALVAFTIENAMENESRWSHYVDPLNPGATQAFIEYTHERYKQVLGDMFGREIQAIFTDEPKYYGKIPYTDELFKLFEKTFSYDLKTRLYHLFAKTATPEAMKTRLDYREWCGQRFQEAWMMPIAKWCKQNNLKFVGHISPEDDPVTQACCLSNLMPVQKHFDLPGLDIIIPAIGDKDHPLINIGVLSAVSVAQQEKRIGVLSESLACSGYDVSMLQLRRIINWQTVMGMTTPVVHGIYSSLKGNRKFECPPDYGPRSRLWQGMQKLDRYIQPFQAMLLGARQIAPVAILWPIRLFYDLNEFWQAEPGGLREELTTLTSACLQAHIGIQFIDESTFQEAKLKGDELVCGNARYSHLIVPGSTVWQQKTCQKIKRLHQKSAVTVYRNGTLPTWQQTAKTVSTVNLKEIPSLKTRDLKKKLPLLADISGKDADTLFVSRWQKNKQEFLLLYYPGTGKTTVSVNGKKQALSPQKIVEVR